MLLDRVDQAEWLEWSGLPLELNKVRSGGWTVFKKIVDLDCRAHRCPGTIEISFEMLGDRCGFEPDTTLKIVEALRKKKYLRCYLPDNFEEPALLEIRTPLKTPRSPEEVARRVDDPHLRDVSRYRYASEEPERSADEAKIQEVVDLYFNHLSQKMNSFIVEQIEIVARRFEIDEIRHTMERAARHDLRSIGWVLKELIRDHAKKEKESRV